MILRPLFQWRPLGCGMNYKIRVTSVVGGETVSPTDMKLIPAGRNTGIQLCIKDTGCGLKQHYNQ